MSNLGRLGMARIIHGYNYKALFFNYKSLNSLRNVGATSAGARQLATLSDTVGAEDLPVQARPLSEMKSGSVNSVFKGINFFFKYMLTGKLHLYFKDLHDRLGPIYRVKLGGYDELVLVSDPQSLETVLRHEGKHPSRIQVPVWTQVREDLGFPQGIVTGEGEQWYKLRKATEKPFLRVKDVSTYTEDVNQVSADLMNRLRERRLSDGSVTNIQDHIFLFSCEAVGTVIFNTRMGFLSGDDDPYVQRLIQGVHQYFGLTQKMTFLPLSVTKRLLPHYWNQFKAVTKDIYSIGDKYIAAQKELAEKNKEEVKGFLGYILKQENLTPSEINSVTSEMLGAGIDTTSNSIQWILYELARNPDIQERLFEEVSRVMGPGNSPTLSDLQEMELLRATVKESLRMYPVGSSVSCIVPKDMVLHGYHIPAGTCVLASLFVTGRSPDVFPDPDKFHPERWLRRNRGKQTNSEKAFSSLPFGFGTRSCVGRRIAELEMHLCTAHLVKNFRIEANFTGEIGIASKMILMPERPVDVKLIDRK